MATSVVCPACGSAVGVGGKPKTKSTAVLLAVFLGLWTWIYTYDRDKSKFWISIVLSVLTLGFFGLIAWVWAVIDTTVKPQSYYDNFPTG